MKKLQVVSALVFSIVPVLQAQTLYTANFNFNGLTPPPGFSGGPSYVDPTYGYTFTAAAGNLGWNLYSGPVGGLYVPSNLTITRADHHLFNLDSLTLWYGGHTITPLDFEVIPFDSAGNEGDPIPWSIYGPALNDIIGFPTVVSNISRVQFNFMNGAGGYKIMIISMTSDVPPVNIPCPGDLNGDRVVNLADLAIVLANYGLVGGATPTQGDLNGDGNVDLSDLAAMLGLYGATCP